MGYSYTATTPHPGSPLATLPAPETPASETPAPTPPPLTHMEKILALIDATHGPDIRVALVRYSANLANAVRLTAEIEQAGAEAGADPAQPGVDWLAWEAEILSAVTSYHDAADAMADLTGTKACTTSLLATLPSALLGRIIRAGLECEADELLNLLECVSPRPPENGTPPTAHDATAPGCAGGSAPPE